MLERLLPEHNRRFGKPAAAGERRAPAAGAGASTWRRSCRSRSSGWWPTTTRSASSNRFYQLLQAGLSGRAWRQGGDRGATGWEHGDPLPGALPEVPGGRGEAAGLGAPPPDPRSLAHWRPTPVRRRRRPGPREGGRAHWRTADRRALGSHSCGALSSRRRGGG